MSSEIFGRVLIVQVANVTVDLSTHDIDVTIDAGSSNTSTSKAATAEIGIWNVGDSFINNLKKGAIVQVSAGYEGSNGVIFYGTIDEVSPERNGADTCTVIQATDAKKTLKTADVISIVFKKESSVSDAMRQVVGKTTLAIGKISFPPVKFDQESSYQGTPDAILQQLVKYANGELIRTGAITELAKGVKYYVEGNTVFIVDAEYVGAEAVWLSYDTGLQQISRVRKASSDGTENTTSTGDYRVRTYLNYEVGISSLIRLQTDDLRGNYRVISYRHITTTDEFATEMVVVAI